MTRAFAPGRVNLIVDHTDYTGGNPIPATLLLLALIVGLPFFVVATSAPLLQKWFAATGHPAAKDPYFLYGASNFGSMLSLLAYPFIVEPWLTLHTQAYVWTAGCVFFVLMFNFFFIWLRARFAGAPVTLLELIALRLRGVPPPDGITYKSLSEVKATILPSGL